jgi:hypothetical protein
MMQPPTTITWVDHHGNEEVNDGICPSTCAASKQCNKHRLGMATKITIVDIWNKTPNISAEVWLKTIFT